MNFIEAYQLIHDKYAAVLAKPPEKTSLFISEKLLPDSKQNILNAYKIFVAHVLLYGTRTPEELDRLYWTTIMRLDFDFAPDDIVKKQEWALTVLTKKSALYKRFHKKDIELANIIMKETSLPTESPCYQELIAYYNVMVDYAKSWRERYKSRIDAGEKSSAVFAEMHYEYCKTAYVNANIHMNEDDPEYFFTFETLRKISKNPKLKDIHEKYASYYQTRE